MSKRRRFTPEFKTQVISGTPVCRQAGLSGAKSSAQLCRQHRLSVSLLSDWKAAFLQRASLLFQGEEQRSLQAARGIASGNGW